MYFGLKNVLFGVTFACENLIFRMNIGIFRPIFLLFFQQNFKGAITLFWEFFFKIELGVFSRVKTYEESEYEVKITIFHVFWAKKRTFRGYVRMRKSYFSDEY